MAVKKAAKRAGLMAVNSVHWMVGYMGLIAGLRGWLFWELAQGLAI